MKKKIFIGIILFIIFLVFSLLIYINNVFAPAILKPKIISALEKKLQANIHIENIRYNLFSGLIIQNLAVYKETKDSPYLTVKEISFSPLLAPLLRKQIIIPLIRVESPKIFLELDENTQLGLDKLYAPAVATTEKPEFSLAVLKISVSDGGCYFKDKTATPHFTREMTAVKIGMEIKPNRQIKFLLQAKITNPQSNPSFLSAEGEYSPAGENLSAQIKLNSFIIKEYLTYLKKFPFLFSEGIIDADLKVSMQKKLLNLTGSVTSKAIVIRDEKFAFSGDLTLKPQLEYGLEDKITKFQAVAQIARAKFLGLKFTKEITDIQGDIHLDETQARTLNLKAKIFDSPAKITGSLENFAQPVLKLKISSERVKLNNLTALLPNPPKDLAIDGQARLLMGLNYDANNNPPLEIKGIAVIGSTKLKAALLKNPVENIKGAVVFSNNGLAWPSMFFNYKNIPYKTSGSVKDFNLPEISCELASRELSLKSNLSLRNDTLSVNSCSGKYLQSEFDIKGNADIRQAVLDLSGKINLNLKNIFGLLTDNAREKFQKIKLDGACKIEGRVKGSIKEPKKLEADLKVASDVFSIYGLKINNASLNLKQADAILSTNDFTANSYDGNINAQFSLNSTQAIPDYSAKFILENVNLAKLKKDTGAKDKELEGLLNIKGELQGSTENIDTLKGSGYLMVKDGKLWEINLFKGLGEFLFLPIYQRIVFSDIDGDFFIQDKKIRFTNAFLGGKMMEMATNGYIGFDGAIDLDMHARISKSLLEDSADLRKFGSAIFGNLLYIKITGSLQKPQYEVLPIPKALLKEIKDSFQKH